jgi:hypothetical protein
MLSLSKHHAEWLGIGFERGRRHYPWSALRAYG